MDLDLEKPKAPAEAPARGKWLEEVRTTVWEGSTLPEPPLEPEPAGKRQTAPYLSQPHAPAASPCSWDGLDGRPPQRSESAGAPPRPSTPMDVGGPRPVSLGARAEAPRAVVAERSSRSGSARPHAADPVARIATPVPQVEDLDARPTGGYRTVERELDEESPATRPPLMLEAAIQIKERVVEQISPDPRLWLLTEPGSKIADQYRVLALKLREVSYLRVVALVPPAGGKDQGLAACNVALAFAEGNRTRVLLVDANLRTPVLHDLFGLQAGWTGLAEQVRQHRRNPNDAWNILGVTANLGLMPSGPEPERNPSAVLSADPIAELFAEARRSYDLIVVSPPPVLESADVNILQDHIDGAVLVVRAGVTRRDSVAASLSRLSARKFIGSVLTNARS